VGEVLRGTGIATQGGAVLLGEVLAVTGVESRMVLRRHLAVGDEVEVSDGEGIGTGIVTTITGGCRRLEGIVILRLPDVVDVVATAETVGTVGTVGEAGEGRETRDLVAHPAETPDTIESAADTRGGVLCGIFTCGRLYNSI